MNLRMYKHAYVHTCTHKVWRSAIMLFALFCDLMFTGLSKPIVLEVFLCLRSWWWNSFFLQTHSFPQCDCITVYLTKFLEAVWKVSHFFFPLTIAPNHQLLSPYLFVCLCWCSYKTAWLGIVRLKDRYIKVFSDAEHRERDVYSIPCNDPCGKRI